jgi:hypothetical protein
MLGSHSDESECGCLLGCSTVLSGTNLPTFQKRFKTMMMMKAVNSSETFVSIDQTSSYCIPEDSHHKNTFDCL